MMQRQLCVTFLAIAIALGPSLNSGHIPSTGHNNNNNNKKVHPPVLETERKQQAPELTTIPSLAEDPLKKEISLDCCLVCPALL